MLTRCLSSSIMGFEPYLIEVETDSADSQPKFAMVGLPSESVKESYQRVSAAMKNSGFFWPLKRITINLAPADIRKDSAALDLPIAMGILSTSLQVPEDKLKDYLLIGELSLDGALKPVKGILPITLFAKENGLKGVILPLANAREAAVVYDIDVIGVECLKDAADFLSGFREIEPTKIDREQLFDNASLYEIDFSDVKGQEHAKRAIQIAAAGGHNLIMIGPPGSGKTMLAKRLPTILPKLTFDEALEITKIHSIVGLLAKDDSLIAKRPFRSPHHTISDAGLIGGGKYPSPGEVSLSHNGVLFLDELPEFKRQVLEVMRQPMEDGVVTISRANSSVAYPSRFMMVAASNPCPCGYYPGNKCTCSEGMVSRYMSKISGPLMDRIDIHIEVADTKFSELTDERRGESSEVIRRRIDKARDIQIKRFEKNKSVFCNAQMESRHIREYCVISEQSKALLHKAIDRFGFSARAYTRILKVARTIADIEGTKDITSAHISEAIQYRSLEKKN